MRRAPALELLHGLGEECLGDTALLEIGAHGQWAEEADAAPLGSKIRADQFSIELRRERGDVWRGSAAMDVIPIAPKCLRIGRAEIGAESKAHNAGSIRQVFFIEFADNRAGCLRTSVAAGINSRHDRPLANSFWKIPR